MRRSRSILRLEALEGRLVPSVSTSYLAGGSLYLTGTTRGELDIKHITGTSPSMFQVTDNGANLGSYNILGTLYLSLTNRLGDVKIDLNAGFLPGNVIISLGNGYVGASPFGSSVDLYDDNATPTGKIGGTVTVLGGNGQEMVDVGAFRNTGTGLLTADPIRIGGNATIAFSRSAGSQGNSLTIDDGTSIGGSVTATLVSQFAMGSSSSTVLVTIGQDLAINDYGSLRPLFAVVAGAVGRNLSVTGTELDDNFNLAHPLPGGGVVGGSLTVNLEDGQTAGDRITLSDNTQVDGNAQLTAGSNLNTVMGDQFKVGGSVFGSLTVQMGGGMNKLLFEQQNPGDPAPYVGGNMTVVGGNGSNSISFMPDMPGDAQPIINGYLSITLGNGANGTLAVPNLIDAVLGGALYWKSGNGPNFVQLGNNAIDGYSENYNVHMLFGNDDDSVTIDIGTGFLTGLVDEGGRILGNSFSVTSGTIGSPFSLYNVP